MIHFFKDQFIEIAGWYKDRAAFAVPYNWTQARRPQ